MSRVYRPQKITEAIRKKKLNEEHFFKDSGVIVFKFNLDAAGNQFKASQFNKHIKERTKAFLIYLLAKNALNDFVRFVSNFKVQGIIYKDSIKEIVQLVEVIDFKSDKSKIHEELVLASEFDTRI